MRLFLKNESLEIGHGGPEKLGRLLFFIFKQFSFSATYRRLAIQQNYDSKSN
jgi:hypothetical protein